MRQLQVELEERSYPILIGESLIHSLGNLFLNAGIDPRRKVLVVTDEHVAPLYLKEVQAQLSSHGFKVFQKVVPAGEQSKSLEVYTEVMTVAIECGLDRQSIIVALGGGMIGDLAGFVAATFMRGVSFVQVPTTLLAHDSSVGGKVAVNHPLGKNMIGAFHQPLMVIYDLNTLRTLPRREILNGYAEVIKHAAIWHEDFFYWLDTHAAELLRLENEYLQDALYKACQIKAHVVSEDEREEGLRAILNFGHTLGHALESVYGYKEVAHGEGVAIGMSWASLLATHFGLPIGIHEKIVALLEKFQLPTALPENADIASIVQAMLHDKKMKNNKFMMVLPEKIGRVRFNQEVDTSLVENVLGKLLHEQRGVS